MAGCEVIMKIKSTGTVGRCRVGPSKMSFLNNIFIDFIASGQRNNISIYTTRHLVFSHPAQHPFPTFTHPFFRNNDLNKLYVTGETREVPANKKKKEQNLHRVDHPGFHVQQLNT